MKQFVHSYLSPRFVGFVWVVTGFITMCFASSMDNVKLVITQGFIMLVGAVLSLHPVREKKRGASEVTFNAHLPQNIADEIAKRQAERRKQTGVNF